MKTEPKMINFKTKEEAEQFTKEWNSWLANEFTEKKFVEYISVNRLDFYNLTEEEQLQLMNTPATEEPFENKWEQILNHIMLEMFLVS